MTQNIISIDGFYYVSPAVAAQIANVSIMTLNRYLDDPEPPPYDPLSGMYPLVELGEWCRRKQIYRRGVGGSFPYKPDLSRYGETEKPVPEEEDPKVRLTRLQGDKVEMHLRERARELVPADAVVMAWTSIASRVKTKLLTIPSSASPVIAHMNDPVKIEEHLKGLIYETLAELSSEDILGEPEEDVLGEPEGGKV